jgi:hypothetical protein
MKKKSYLFSWADRAKAAKQAAKDSGIIKGDADLSARVSEILEEHGLPPVESGAINHWINGRNPPSVPYFLAFCKALSVDPSGILSSSMSQLDNVKRLHGGLGQLTEDVIKIMESTDDVGRGIILGAARTAIIGYVPSAKRKRPK